MVTEGLELVVTERDIEGARRCSSCGCPLSTAFSRVFGLTALVNYDTEWRADGSRVLCAYAQVQRRRWKLPQIAVDFMRRWDQGIPCRSISFPLPKEAA